MAAHYKVTIVDDEPAYEERKTSTQTKRQNNDTDNAEPYM
jgi:hypothetical protein